MTTLIRKSAPLVLTIIGLSIQFWTYGQGNPPVTIPQGYFLADSFDVGRPFRFAISFRHLATEDVIFPDSAAFLPLLLRQTTFLPTRTDAGISADSAVYTLVSFATDPQLTLRVPLYVVGTADCTTVYSSADTIFFRSSVRSARPDTLRLQSMTTVVPLRQELNYPVLLAVAILLGILGVVVYILFGQALIKQWRLLELNRNHRLFLRQYNKLINSLDPDTAADAANQAVVRWKKYMERLEQQPFSTMTTSEIVDQITGQQVAAEQPATGVENALKNTDRLIYGGAFTEESKQALQLLREVAVHTYRQRRKTVQHIEQTEAVTNSSPKSV